MRWLTLSAALLLAVHMPAQLTDAPDAITAAIKARDHAALAKLLKAGAALDWVNPTSHYKYVDLTFNNGDLEALKLLVEAGEDVNAPDGLGITPLIYSVHMGHVDQTEYLLAHGARIEDRDKQGATALVAAVNYNSTPMVALLLKHGADVTAVDRRKTSLLQRASLANEAEIVALLKKAGAKDDSAGEQMMAAAANGDVVRLRELIANGAPVDFAGEQGETPLMAAARKGQTVAVRALLAAGANPSAVAKGSSQTPLFCALQSAHRSTVDEILAAGADPKQTWGMGGTTTLMRLVTYADDPELAQRLIDAGVDVNAITSNGSRFTALMQAATFGRTETVKLLLRDGASVNIATVLEGDTALIDAARSGHKDIVELLLKAGADPTMKDHRTKNNRPDGEPIPGKTAIDWATEYHHPEIAAVLESQR